MTTRSLNLQAIDIRRASEKEYLALNAFDNVMRAERSPDDPPHTLQKDVVGWQNIPAFVQLYNWIIWSEDATQIVASGGGGFADWETNRHLMFCNLEVLPGQRRRGLARLLLARVAETAQQLKRRLLVVFHSAGRRSVCITHRR
jgi:GNAT superfamily N-acetyltransferase